MFDCLCCPLNWADKREFDNGRIPSAFIKKSPQKWLDERKKKKELPNIQASTSLNI